MNMKRYIAFLRGVNISGKNKILMAELEKIKDYKESIFWSFSRKDYQKTNWWSKTANTNISSKLTIRTAATVRKIIGM